MKTAVVYFTRDGSTRVAAELLAKKAGADLFELEEVRKRGKSAMSFMAAGFGAAVGRHSRLKESFSAEMKKYDIIYIGTPIWAGKTTPAFNSFVKSLDVVEKKLVLFTVQADPAPEEKPAICLEMHKHYLEKRGATVINMLRLNGAAPGKTADSGHIETQLDRKISV